MDPRRSMYGAGRRWQLLLAPEFRANTTEQDRKNFRRSYASPCIWSPKGTRGQRLFIFPGACYARYQGEQVIFCIMWL